MADEDPLTGLEEQLEALEGRPLAEHADTLEEIRQTLVAELDRLDSTGDAGDDEDVEGDSAG